MMPTALSNLLRMFRPSSAPPVATPSVAPHAIAGGSCGELVATDGRLLPLRALELRAVASGGLARVTLVQRFANAHAEPLHVTYRMALPADAAVSGYAFQIAGKRIVGQVDKKKKARERFERALIEGKTAGIVEQERSSVFTQELGNVPPGAEILAELTLDQRLVWRSEGAWEWRFPTTMGPRYVGPAGQVPDADRIAVKVAEHGVPARLTLGLAVHDRLAGETSSPSHALRATHDGDELRVVLAAEDGARLDRDLVVRWPVAARDVATRLDVGRPADATASFGLLTLVPPLPEEQRAARRDLILLLDTSGSMGGEPLAQLQKTARALISTLTDDDTLEMIEFSSSPSRWKSAPVNATASARADATRWVERLSAGGGTEMVSGMLEALAPLTATSQRQVVLMTDGYIGGEVDVISQVMGKLPHGRCRVHVVGVGSAVNRTLTGGVARAGGGVEVIIAPGEEPTAVVADLLARTAAPLVIDLAVSGSALVAHAPAQVPSLYAGAPALISLHLRAEGGELELSGRTAAGPWRQRLQVPARDAGEGNPALAALFAREAVEDLELARTAAPHEHAAIDQTIEELGLRFQISTRLTTWVAVSDEATVDPSRPGRREDMPSELPRGVSLARLGLMTPPAPVQVNSVAAPMAAPALGATMTARSYAAGPPPPSGAPTLGGVRGRLTIHDGDSFSDIVELEEALAPSTELARQERQKAPERKAAAPAKDARDQVRRRPSPGPAAPPAQEGEASAGARAQAPVRARLRQRLGDQLVLELELASRWTWDPTAPIAVRLADGKVVRGTLCAGSTAAGVYDQGQLVRLVLELPTGERAAPTSLRIDGLEIPVVA